MDATGHYFQTIGNLLKQRLNERTEDVDAVFPEIAAAVLMEIPTPPIDVVAMADWAAAQNPLPKQVNFHFGFGQPPLVVFETPQFYLEVLFWFPSRTSIHGHGFTGAFRVLDGYSIQVEYEFIEESIPEEGVRLGRTLARDVTLIAPGRVCTIMGRDDFIHSVAHLGNPSLTLVARTHGPKEMYQFTFLRCGFAFRSHLHKQSLERQADVFHALFRARPELFCEKLLLFLDRADRYTFFRVLGKLRDRLTLPVFSKDLLPAVRARFGSSQGPVLAALDEELRSMAMWGLVRAQTEPRKQFLFALAELFPDETERNALICRSQGVSEAKPVIEAWIQQVCPPPLA